jgi:hypothetical protein
MFLYRGPGVFEAHCFFEQRGKKALAVTREMLRMMAEDYGATRLIWAAVPEHDRKVKLFVRWLGFKSTGHETLANGPCELFILENK